MKVKLIPGPRDEEKIAAILNAKKAMSLEDWYNFMASVLGPMMMLGLMHYTMLVRMAMKCLQNKHNTFIIAYLMKNMPTMLIV